MTRPARPIVPSLLRSGAIAATTAAACTTAVALIAQAADVGLEVDGTAIPVGAFAWWTVVGTVLGVMAAWLAREPRRFFAVTVTATALSLVPAVAMPDDTGTRLVLVGAHLVAATIVIPILGRQMVDALRSDARGGRLTT